ncbi:unnamed protein product [Cuscuta europaea]|uniref:Uncharacterized protein n=1 Tax=Cuscuta europaea TaxID=41803 RepID=A0A9P0Z2H6_CUSEU|nr:unnamed protein product [Cuscuta europaea]
MQYGRWMANHHARQTPAGLFAATGGGKEAPCLCIICASHRFRLLAPTRLDEALCRHPKHIDCDALHKNIGCEIGTLVCVQSHIANQTDQVIFSFHKLKSSSRQMK